MSVKLYRVAHSEPNEFRWDYILLPYGQYYPKTASLLNAHHGDTLRFFEGRDVMIEAVRLVEDPVLCNMLCRMRYGVAWPAAFKRWQHYARLEGNGPDILSKDKCIIITFSELCKDGES